MQEAINCWKRALSIDDTLINCYQNIGNTYYKLGELKEAVEYWTKVLSFAPNHTNALINLGTAYDDLEEKSLAFKFYEMFLKYTKNNKKQDRDYIRIGRKVHFSKKLACHNYKSGLKYQKALLFEMQ